MGPFSPLTETCAKQKGSLLSGPLWQLLVLMPYNTSKVLWFSWFHHEFVYWSYFVSGAQMPVALDVKWTPLVCWSKGWKLSVQEYIVGPRGWTELQHCMFGDCIVARVKCDCMLYNVVIFCKATSKNLATCSRHNQLKQLLLQQTSSLYCEPQSRNQLCNQKAELELIVVHVVTHVCS